MPSPIALSRFDTLLSLSRDRLVTVIALANDDNARECRRRAIANRIVELSSHLRVISSPRRMENLADVYRIANAAAFRWSNGNSIDGPFNEFLVLLHGNGDVWRWRVSRWSKCSACDGKTGKGHRKVQCVRPAARAGEDDVQANLDACKGRVPKQTEECVGKMSLARRPSRFNLLAFAFNASPTFPKSRE